MKLRAPRKPRSNPSRYRRETGKLWDPRLVFDLTQASHETYTHARCGSIPRYYFHMGETEKVGFNYNPSYGSTPLGVYAYPLNPEYLEKLLKGGLPYLAQAKYVSVLELREPQKCWVLCSEVDEKIYEELKIALHGNFGYRVTQFKREKKELPALVNKLGLGSQDRVNVFYYISIMDSLLDRILTLNLKDVNKLRNRCKTYLNHLFDNIELILERVNRHPRIKEILDFSGVANYCDEIAPLSDRARSTALRRMIVNQSYTSLLDTGRGAIYDAEPSQIVFLTPSSYRVVSQFATYSLNAQKREEDYRRKARTVALNDLIKEEILPDMAGIAKALPRIFGSLFDPSSLIFVPPVRWETPTNPMVAVGTFKIGGPVARGYDAPNNVANLVKLLGLSLIIVRRQGDHVHSKTVYSLAVSEDQKYNEMIDFYPPALWASILPAESVLGVGDVIITLLHHVWNTADFNIKPVPLLGLDPKKPWRQKISGYSLPVRVEYSGNKGELIEFDPMNMRSSGAK